MAGAGEPREVGSVRRESLARIPIRMRESAVTLSAWRMETSGAQGRGTIVLVELPSGARAFRGEGAHLGWTQEKLAALWRTLSEGGDPEPPFEIPQLG